MKSYIQKNTLILATIIVSVVASAIDAAPKKFDEVNKDYTKVVSTINGEKSLFDLWANYKDNQLLAELPRGWDRKKFFIAVTPSAGVTFAGLQGNVSYVYFKRYGDRLAIVEPEISVRSSGDKISQDAVDTIFTDSVLIDVPIVATGPNGQPVIDLDSLLVNNASKIAGFVANGAIPLSTTPKIASSPLTILSTAAPTGPFPPPASPSTTRDLSRCCRALILPILTICLRWRSWLPTIPVPF